MALSYVFQEQLYGGTLALNRALSDGCLTSAQQTDKLTDRLAASEKWTGPWRFNGDPFTDTEKEAYEAKVLTARRKNGHKGHTKAVRRLAKALDIDENQAASVLGQRGRIEALRNIMTALGISEEEAASELGQRGGGESARADEREIAGLAYSSNLKRDRKSMSARGALSKGVPRTGGTTSTTMILHDKDDDHYYYSVTNPPMEKKLVELRVFNTTRTAENNMKRLKDYAKDKGEFKLVPGKIGKGNKSDRGAGSKDMPPHLDLWLSVGKVPEGENVTKLTN
jgi:hypothetical protein